MDLDDSLLRRVAEALPEKLQDQRRDHRAARRRAESMSGGGDTRRDCAYLCDEGMGRNILNRAETVFALGNQQQLYTAVCDTSIHISFA